MTKMLQKNKKGYYFVAVALSCLLISTSAIAAVTGVSKLQNQRNALVDDNNGMRPDSHKKVASFKEHAEIEDLGISEPVDVQSEEMLEQYQTRSLFFTENRGQFPEEVLFQTHVSGAIVYLCKDKVVSVFTRNVDDEPSVENDVPGMHEDDISELMMHDEYMDDAIEPSAMDSLSVWATFEGANSEVQLVGINPLTHYNNYFIGNDPDKWYTHVQNFEEVVYQDIYSGIDLRYYFSEGGLKYDFIVDAGADSNQIVIRYDGVDNLGITDDGDLSIGTAFGNLGEKVPVIYQDDSTGRTLIDGGYQLLDDENRFGFTIDASYDSSLPLVIDPELEYSTFLGETSSDYGRDIAVDDDGCAYIAGYTTSSDFPTTPGAYDTTFNGGDRDVFVTKLTSTGDDLVYSTFLGGTDNEYGQSIAVDDSGCAYVTGYTYSSNFPTTPDAYDTYCGSWLSDVFVTKLTPMGDALVYSTYLGKGCEDKGAAIAVDADGCAYVTGYVDSFEDTTGETRLNRDTCFPTTPGAFDTTFNGYVDVFVTKFNPTGSALVYSTYLGGTSISGDYGQSIAVDDNGITYVTGYTYSSDFPTTPGAYDTTFNGGSDVFVTKLNPTAGSGLIYSTFLGGTGSDRGYGIAVDAEGCAHVTGYTYSSDFPTTPGAYDTTFNGGYTDVFVTKFTPLGDDLVYSTFLGGTSSDYGYGIAVDNLGFAYVTGRTGSPDFPTTSGAYDTTYNGWEDVFVTELNLWGSGLMNSTFLGGADSDYGRSIAVDDYGSAYIAGYTKSADFPTTPGAYDTTYNGGVYDVFVTKIIIIMPNDVGVVSINYPTGIQRPGDYVVNATVVNYGSMDQTIPMHCSIYNETDSEVYSCDTSVFILGCSYAYVEFTPAWQADTPGDYRINVTTMLPDDENPENDAKEITMAIELFIDVGVVSINYPSDIIQPGSVSVNATVENYGDVDQVVPVNCLIYKGIEQILLMEDFEGTQFPPEGWSIVQLGYTGLWEQEAYTTGDVYEPPDTTGSSYYAEADNGEHPSDSYSVGLFTPPFDLTGYDEVTLNFDRNFQIWTSPAGYDYGYGRVKTYVGGTGISHSQEAILYLDESDPSEGVFTELTFDPSSYSDPSEVYICFYYNDENAQSGYGKFCIDNVDIFVGISDYELVYSSETMVSVAAGSAVDVEFTPPWDATPGDYLVTVSTLLPEDENPENDQMEKLVTVENSPPPTPPEPTGTTLGTIGVEYWYWNDGVVDPDGDTVEYLFDWGDGNDSGWNTSLSASHSWSAEGVYEVKVKARDCYLLESEWSEPRLVTILEDPCPWDVNKDGMVNPQDVGLVKYHYGCDPSDPLYEVFDVNRDGSINPQDVGIVKFHYGPCPVCG
jgi:hypothetical protein